MTNPGDTYPDSVAAPTEGARPTRNVAGGSAVLFGAVAGLLGLLLTLAVSHWLGEVDRQSQVDNQIHDATRITSALKSRMGDYEVFTRTVAGLFSASENVSAIEWDRFMRTAGVELLVSRGAMGVAFAPRVEPEQRRAWEARLVAAQQNPVALRGELSSTLFPVEYVAPAATAALPVGRNLLGSVSERDAVRHALAINEAVLSAPIRFGGDALNTLGALIVMPVTGRRPVTGPQVGPFDRLDAVVAVAVSYGEWIDSVLIAWSNVYAVELSDPGVGTGRPLLTAPAGLPQVGPEQSLTVGGRRLVLRFFSLRENARPLVEKTAFAAGLMLSVGLAWMVYFLIAGRHRAENRAARMLDALADSERRFALAMSATSDGVWEWLPGQARVFLSARASSILLDDGEERQLALRTVLSVFPRSERSVVLTAIRAHLKQRSPLDVELSGVGADGMRRHVRLRGQAQWDAMGRMVRLAGAVLDVTELRGHERELRNTQHFYARILEAFPLPVMIKTSGHRYQLCNKAACEFAGLSREALLNGSTNDLLPGQADVHYAMDDEVLASGACVSKEFHVHLRDGREGDVVISKLALDGPDGAPVVLVVISDVTSLRRAERALRASLFEFDGLFRNSPLGMAMISKHGVIRRVNKAFAHIVGRSEAELAGRSYRDITPARFHSLDREKTLDALRSGSVTPYERAFLRPDGAEVPVVLSGAIIHGNDEEPGIWTVVEDISARKAGEAELHRMHAINQSMLDAMPDSLLQFDADLRLIAARISEADVLSAPAEARMGQPLEALLSPSRYRAVRPLFDTAMLARQLAFTEFGVRRSDGLKAYYEARISPVTTGGVLVVLRNVTEKRLREKALRESESRFRLLADAAPVIIWVADARLNVSYVNRRWGEITGIEPGTDRAVDWLAQVHPDDVRRVRATLRQARNARESFELACRCRRSDGTHVWLMLTGALRYTEHGEFAGFICIGTDVTEVRQAHLELQRHRDHLAELVAEQTASVLMAKEMAERANEAKSMFLANMSHELRSPMHVVLSYARLGEDKCRQAAPEKLVDYFQRIRTSGERLLRLLNDLLDLSKLEARQMHLDRDTIVLCDLVDEVVREFEGMISAKRLDVACHERGEALSLHGDPVRLGQVIRNLVANAIKFSPVGGKVALSVECTKMRAGRRESDQLSLRALQLEICDEGPGIPAEELERVFDKFVQSSKTRTGAGGTGLGLAICREIVVAHGGTIHAENGVAGGARFVVVLPVDPVPGMAEHIAFKEHSR